MRRHHERRRKAKVLACPTCRDIYDHMMERDPAWAAKWLGIKSRTHHGIMVGWMSSKDRDVARRRDKLKQRREWKLEVNNARGTR